MESSNASKREKREAVRAIQASWLAYAPYHHIASFHRLLHTPPSLAGREHARTVQHLTTFLTTGPAQTKEDFLNRVQELGYYPFAAVDRTDGDGSNQHHHNNKRGPAAVLWSELLHADNGRSLVKAGSIPFLIQSLISDYGGVEQTFLEDFLFTYRTFLTPHALLLLLIFRYWVPLGEKADKREEREKKQRIPTQIKTVRVLRMWIEMVPTDFTGDDVLTANATAFLTGIETFKVASGEILNMLKEKRNPGGHHDEEETHAQPLMTSRSRGQSDGPERGVNFEGTTAADDSDDGDSDSGLGDSQKIKSGRDRSFLSFDPVDVAFEWTLFAQRVYRAVTPREFVKQAWNKKDRLERAPNVSALIEDFNQMSEWVSLVVLSYRDRKRRGEAISRFINIAYECHKLKNYHTVMVILSGLTKAHITRLKKSWEIVDNRSKSKLKLMNELMGMESNYQHYRQALRETMPPTPSVPFLGLFLTDLTFLDEGNSELLSSSERSAATSVSSSAASALLSSDSSNGIRTAATVSKRRSFFKVKSDRSVKPESKLRDSSNGHAKEDLSASAALIEKSTQTDLPTVSPRNSMHGLSTSNKRLNLHKKSQSEDGDKRLSLKAVRSLSVYMKGTSEKMRSLRMRKSSTFATLDESELLSNWRVEDTPRLSAEEHAAAMAWKKLEQESALSAELQESGGNSTSSRRSRRAHAKRMPQVFDLQELSEALVKEEKELSNESDAVAPPSSKGKEKEEKEDKNDSEAAYENSSVVEEEMLINWMKQRTMAKVLREFLRFQSCNYPLPKKHEKLRRKLKGRLERKSGVIDHSEIAKEPSSLLSSATGLDLEGLTNASSADDLSDGTLEEIRDMLREMRLPPDIANVLDLSTYTPSGPLVPQVPLTQNTEARTPRGSSSTGNSPRSRSTTALSHAPIPLEALSQVTEDHFKSPRSSVIATSRTPPSLSPRGPSISIKRTTSMPTITVTDETEAGPSSFLDPLPTARSFTPRSPLERHTELFTMKKLKLDDSLLFDLSLHLEPRTGSQVSGAPDKKALFVISPQASPSTTPYRARNKIDRTAVELQASNDSIAAVCEKLSQQQPEDASATPLQHSRSSDAVPSLRSPVGDERKQSETPLETGKASRATREESRPRSNTTSLLPAPATDLAIGERRPDVAARVMKKERQNEEDSVPKAKEFSAGDADGQQAEGAVTIKKSDKATTKSRKVLKSKKSKERLDS